MNPKNSLGSDREAGTGRVPTPGMADDSNNDRPFR